MSWFAVSCVGVGNLYLGRLIGQWGIPVAIRGRRSIPVAALFVSFWIGGLSWLYRINGLQLTLAQACVLAGVVYTAQSATRQEFGLHPKVPWPVVLNGRLDTIIRICTRHKWEISDAESIRELSFTSAIHFDGGDYDLLQQMLTDDEYKFKCMRSALVPRAVDGTIEYDRACAQEIVSLARMLRGDQEIPGMIEYLSQLHDLSDLQWPAYGILLELADAIERQWGKESLWSYTNPACAAPTGTRR